MINLQISCFYQNQLLAAHSTSSFSVSQIEMVLIFTWTSNCGPHSGQHKALFVCVCFSVKFKWGEKTDTYCSLNKTGLHFLAPLYFSCIWLLVFWAFPLCQRNKLDEWGMQIKGAKNTCEQLCSTLCTLTQKPNWTMNDLLMSRNTQSCSVQSFC